MEQELHVPGPLALEKPKPSHQHAVRRTITRHGTKVSYGLLTPGTSPVKASENQVRFLITCSLHPAHVSVPQLTTAVGEKDVEMDDTFTGNSSPTPSPGPNFDLPAPLESELNPHLLNALEDRIWALTQENAALLEKEQYVLRKLSRGGNGTISNIEAVTDRAVRQRDELRVENQELRAVVERLESGIVDLQDRIARIQDKLDRAQGERIEMAQSRRRWVFRVWALAGRLPGELRKKDSEIENMREKLVDMHARLAQEQSRLQEVQGQLVEERKRRMDVEVEFNDSKAAHTQEIKERDLAGQRLRGQLMNMISGLESGAVSI
jgi:predicted  nucleic acid-binding Zn-ribbon protein